MTPAFLFATGIENSAPTIRGGKARVDEMEKCGHYQAWREDFDLVQELDIHFLRYGPPLHRTFLGPEFYDWDFADETFGAAYRQLIHDWRTVLPTQSVCLPVVFPDEYERPGAVDRTWEEGRVLDRATSTEPAVSELS